MNRIIFVLLIFSLAAQALAQESKKLIWSNSNDSPFRVLSSNLDGSETEGILNSIDVGEALFFNLIYSETEDALYWSDVGNLCVYRMPLMSTQPDEFFCDVEFVEGIAIDFDKSYFFAYHSTLDAIEILRLNLMNMQYESIVTLEAGPYTASDLAIDREKELLYWHDVGDQSIQVSDYDGNNQNKVVNVDGNISDGANFTLDDVNQIIYWTDYSTNTINSVKTDGTEQAVVVTDAKGPRDLQYSRSENRLYWVGESQLGVEEFIFSYDLDDETLSTVISDPNYKTITSLTLVNDDVINALEELEEAASSKFRIYPNPTDSKISIELDPLLNYDISVLDFHGKVVHWENGVLGQSLIDSCHQINVIRRLCANFIS